jgi:hypothetical protein
MSAEPWSATAAQLFLIVGLSVLDDALEELVVSLRRHTTVAIVFVRACERARKPLSGRHLAAAI